MQTENLSDTLGVLSAMVTPAVLILASSSLIVATSNRLGRAIDRTRTLSERIVDLAREEDRTMLEEERRLLFAQLSRTARRAKLLTSAMRRLYMATAIFIATSVVLGVVAALGGPYAWVALLLGLAGAALLFWSSLLLILESKVALTSVYEEMDFVKEFGAHYAPSKPPANLVGHPPRRPWKRR
jgi:Flp pilus assembly protein TadB